VKIVVDYDRNEGISRELDVAFTLNASDWRGLNRNQKQNAVLTDARVRRLTPREYARLQGFPDSYEIIVSDTQAYKQFGNSVTVPLVKAIAESIKAHLEGKL
jgi:site-specific DNA-cytosine methylase